MRVLALIVLIFSCGHGGLDYLWDATFEADDLRVEHLLELQEDDMLRAGSFQVDPRRIDSENRRTALMMCGYSESSADSEKLDRKCAAIGKMLLDAGANASHVDDYGWDALSMASVKGFTMFCELLVNQEDVDIDRQDEDGRSAIMKAAGHGHMETVIMLWNHGADATALDPQGMTILQQVVNLAVSESSLFPLLREMLEKMVYPKATPKRILSEMKTFREPGTLYIDQMDLHGRTALHYAIISDHKEAVQTLLEFDADPTLQDGFGVTPLNMVRRRSSNDNMIEILTAAAADYAERRHKRWLKDQNNAMFEEL